MCLCRKREDFKLKDFTGLSNNWGEGELDVQLDAVKLKAALKKQEKAANAEADEHKRKYNSLSADGLDVTAEDMEAYRMKKGRTEDPMAKLEQNGAAGGYDFV